MVFRILIFCLTLVIIHSTSFGKFSTQNGILDKAIHQGTAFIENKGQWDDDVRFLTKIGGMNVWITNNGVVFDFYRIKGKGDRYDRLERKFRNKMFKEPVEVRRYGHVVKMNFISHNDGVPVALETGPVFLPLDKRTSYNHYFHGNDPSRWAQFVPLYGEVIVESVFGEDSGIDIRYYYEPEGLRYDFIVHPGARVEDVTFTIEGADGVWVNDRGKLVMLTSSGEVRHKGLKAYQDIDGELREVAVKFHLNGNGQIGFIADREEDAKPLIIDPLIYSTFLGGSFFDTSGWSQRSLALDSEGNVYVTGLTKSDDFPTTPGAYDETFNAEWDCFVSVLNPDLSELLYSTFIGGGGWDEGIDLTFDSDGNVYVSGYTESNDFPTTPGAYDESYNGDGDGFVIALSPDLSNLLYSTFIGGSSMGWAGSPALDSEGNVYVTGRTESDDFPTTPGAYDETFNGEADGFVSVLSPDLSELLYSTFLGGSDWDFVGGPVLDSEGNVYVAGSTKSHDFPTTPGAYDETHNVEDWYDAYISVLSPDLSELLYSTFLSGTGWNEIFSFALDSGGNVYVTGETGSGDFPTTPGAYNEEINGQFDAFVSALSPDLSELLYSTFLGGSSIDASWGGLALDSEGNVYVTGWTDSNDFPTTPDAHDETFNGRRDVFVSVLSPGLSELLYSTFLGGSNVEIPFSLALDSGGNVYVAGHTESNDFPTTPGAYDETFNGEWDVFISKFEQLVVSVRDKIIQDIPQTFTLYQNYPNPFNHSTTIRYGLPERSIVKLKVYNTLGQLVSTLFDEIREAGYHEVQFSASHLPSGVYIYRLQVGEYVESRKMLYLK